MNIKHTINLLFDRYSARRGLDVYPDDVFICSFPKSGNTWVRFLIAHYLYGRQMTGFDKIESLIPDIYVNNNKFLKKVNRPRILKSHEVFDPRYKKIIYIYRDPRDVAISYYFYSLKTKSIPESLPMSDFLHDFIEYGVSDFGTWYDNVNSWVNHASSNKLVISYEDLLKNTDCCLESMLAMLDISIDKSRVSKAVSEASFRKMSSKEKKQSKEWKPLKIYSNSDVPFIRSGKAGQWRAYIPQINEILPSHWIDLMVQLKYDT